MASSTRIRKPPKALKSYQAEIVAADWYQRLDDGRDRACIDTFVKARRIGGSTAAAYRAALLAGGLELRPDGNAIVREPMDVWVVSKDFPSSKGLLKDIAEACDDFESLGPQFAADVQATVIKLGNGRTITALPCSGKACRSKTGAAILDEVAFWRQVDEVYAAAKLIADPTIAEPRGYPVLAITTPWDAGGLANRIFCDASLPYRRHSTNIHEAVAQGFPIDPQRAFAELGIPELIGSEYLCEWVGSWLSFFALDKLRDAADDELPVGWETAKVVYGIDVGGGRGRDFTACVQWRSIDAERWMTGVRAFNDLDIESQADQLAGWIRKAPGLVLVDRGVMGGSLIDLLKNRLAGNRSVTIRGVGMSPQDQERYATNAKRVLERGELRLYTGPECGGDDQGHRSLMLELAQLKTKPGVGGHLSFATPRDASRGHCDRAWAAMIGLTGKGSSTSAVGDFRPGVHTTDIDRDGIGLG
jgi:phage FluMu gp28-like protein